MLLYIIDIIQILTVIVSSIFYYKYRYSPLKYICFYLWYATINDLTIGYYLDYILKETDFLYNIRQILLFALIYYILKKNIQKQIRRKVIDFLFLIYLTTLLIEIVFFKNFISNYLPLSYFTGGLVSLLGIMYYAIERLQSEDTTPIQKDLTVWFLMGNLIFWIGYLPVYIILNNYTYFHEDVINSLIVLKKIFIIVQNIIFIFGFIVSGRVRKS